VKRSPSGDIQITGNTLHVRLDPASGPQRSNALPALCVELTGTATRYPGTDLAYSIKGHPDTAWFNSPCREFWTQYAPEDRRTARPVRQRITRSDMTYQFST
jgi:hypothetical protein